MATISTITYIPVLTPDECAELKRLHQDFGKKALYTSCSVAAASFLLIGALIVISAGCLCLTLPGVNVLNDVIIKAVLPGSVAIVISIPFIVKGVLSSREKNLVRENLLNRIEKILTDYKVINIAKTKDAYDQVDFILINILNWKKQADSREANWIKNTDWTKEYQGKLLGQVKEKIEKNLSKDTENRSEEEKNFVGAFDEARTRVYAKKVNKKRKN